MKQYFNVCDVVGGEVEPVDVITFGSPCQDLSIAGKRAGLKHAENGDEETTRSGLFMEAVRIIKEMRNATNNAKPRFAVWENVPGAFSSGKGEDFRIVLEELAKIKDPTISIPKPPKGKWLTAGEIVGNGFSIAWRVLDAQHWGVPQRRRRIYLVADFGGGSAGEILFEPEGVSRHSEPSRKERKGVAQDAKRGVGEAVCYPLNTQVITRHKCMGRGTGFGMGENGGPSFTLQAGHEHAVAYSFDSLASNSMKSSNPHSGCCEGGVRETILFEPRSQDGEPRIHGDGVSPTLNTAQGGQRQPCVAYSFDSLSSNSMKSSNPHSGCREVDVAKCLDTTDPNPSKNQGGVAVVQSMCFEPGAITRDMGNRAWNEVSPTLRADAGDNQPAVCCLNDQGGSVMSVSENISATLRSQEHGHQPCVVQPQTLKIRSGCEGGEKGALIQDNLSATLGCNNDQTLFEPKAWDGGDISPTLTANNAGGNQRMPDKDNFNCVVEAYGICSKESNSMKSDNPHSGFYKADTSRTIDRSGGNPACNQGGLAVVEGLPFTQNQRNEVRMLGDKSGALCKPATKQQTYVLQRSMIGRKDENGPQGSGVDEGLSFTLNTVDRHAVAYAMTTGGFTQIEEEKSPTLLSRDYKDAPIVSQPSYGIDRAAFNQGQNALYKPAIEEEQQPTLTAKGPGAVAQPASFSPHPDYIVRRLTPTECARLQGFPDTWGILPIITSMTDEDYQFWTECRKVKAMIDGKRFQPKTKEQTIKWYNKLHTDSAEYKAYGNGLALPCAAFVLRGIAKEGAKTLGSLFDGIGGFPLAGIMYGITPLWSSEIEPFAVAVGKERFKARC